MEWIGKALFTEWLGKQEPRALKRIENRAVGEGGDDDLPWKGSDVGARLGLLGWQSEKRGCVRKRAKMDGK